MREGPVLRKAQTGAAATWIFGGFLAVAMFFVLAEHRAHLYGWLPYLLLAACPLMHLFHRHGHSGHGRQEASHQTERQVSTPPPAPASPELPAAPRAHHHHS
jgi:hypothetical protein